MGGKVPWGPTGIPHGTPWPGCLGLWRPTTRAPGAATANELPGAAAATAMPGRRRAIGAQPGRAGPMHARRCEPGRTARRSGCGFWCACHMGISLQLRLGDRAPPRCRNPILLVCTLVAKVDVITKPAVDLPGTSVGGLSRSRHLLKGTAPSDWLMLAIGHREFAPLAVPNVCCSGVWQGLVLQSVF